MARSPQRVMMACLSLVLCSAIMCSGGASRAAMNPTGATVHQTIMAGPYKVVLMIGPLEQMCTQARVKQRRARCSEVMVHGTMVMGGMGGMQGPMPNHHLEVHVYDARSGKTITTAMVAITIRTATGKLVQKLPIATMYGIQVGMSDFHYGNNVALTNGSYEVVTQVQATTALFKVTIGPSSGGMSM